MKKGAFVGKKVPLLGRVIAMVKVDLPKGTGGLTGHHHTSPSHDRAAHTGGWRSAEAAFTQCVKSVLS